MKTLLTHAARLNALQSSFRRATSEGREAKGLQPGTLGRLRMLMPTATTTTTTMMMLAANPCGTATLKWGIGGRSTLDDIAARKSRPPATPYPHQACEERYKNSCRDLTSEK